MNAPNHSVLSNSATARHVWYVLDGMSEMDPIFRGGLVLLFEKRLNRFSSLTVVSKSVW